MNDDPYADRRRLTFEQAEGAEPLPRQLQTKEVSQELRATTGARTTSRRAKTGRDGQRAC